MHYGWQGQRKLLGEGAYSKLVQKLELCLKLHEAYQEEYHAAKRKLEKDSDGKQFDFNEMQIFGKFDLFCRRVIKLIDFFLAMDQFASLSNNKLEGIEPLVNQFQTIVKKFRSKEQDLLDYHQNKFDRDYVEFNDRISGLEGNL
jgi:dynein heavy chain